MLTDKHAVLTRSGDISLAGAEMSLCSYLGSNYKILYKLTLMSVATVI